jgi:hypothetical protein
MLRSCGVDILQVEVVVDIFHFFGVQDLTDEHGVNSGSAKVVLDFVLETGQSALQLELGNLQKKHLLR